MSVYRHEKPRSRHGEGGMKERKCEKNTGAGLGALKMEAIC